MLCFDWLKVCVCFGLLMLRSDWLNVTFGFADAVFGFAGAVVTVQLLIYPVK